MNRKPDRRYMSMVFEVPADGCPNPFNTPTPFGTCISAGIGDEFEVQNAVDYALERGDIDWLRAWNDGDKEAADELSEWLNRD